MSSGTDCWRVGCNSIAFVQLAKLVTGQLLKLGGMSPPPPPLHLPATTLPHARCLSARLHSMTRGGGGLCHAMPKNCDPQAARLPWLPWLSQWLSANVAIDKTLARLAPAEISPHAAEPGAKPCVVPVLFLYRRWLSASALQLGTCHVSPHALPSCAASLPSPLPNRAIQTAQRVM